MKKSLPFYILVVAVFLLVTGDSLFTRGMFMDGMIYGNVAANLAEGNASMWHLHHSNSLFPSFYEHPPLAIFLLSIFYRVLGVHVWVTRLFSVLMTGLTACLMLLIWRRMGNRLGSGWLPLLLWMLVPVVSWSSHNNMLEVTMSVFVVASVLCMLQPARNLATRNGWGALAGVLLFLAFLTKGFTGLYPLAFPAIAWLVNKRYSWRSLCGMLLRTAVPAVVLLLCVGLLCVCVSDARQYLETYISAQVLRGINVPVVDSRWYIVKSMLEQGLLLWIATALGLIVALLRRIHLPNQQDRRFALKFFLLALFGVLPIMISLKQRDFYVLTVYPFVALAAASLLRDWVERGLLYHGQRYKWIFMSVACVVLAVASFYSISYYGKPGRDVDIIEDLDVVKTGLEWGEQVAVPASLFSDYSLRAYYYREHRVDLCLLEEVPDTRHCISEESQASIPADYSSLCMPVRKYQLYELNNNK